MFNWYYKIRRWLVKRGFLKLIEAEKIEADIAEEFFKALLNLMKFSFILDREFRDYIKDFSGIMEFRSRNKEVRVLAIFKNSKLDVKELEPEELGEQPNAIVNFADHISLMNFLLPRGGKRDILRSLLNNEVVLRGNLNYIYRFSFLANHLQIRLIKGIT